MLDPETFMKSSPFQATSKVSYNLSNTTPELLKFQLQEQARAQLQPPHVLESSFSDSAFNSHLHSVLHENSISFEDDDDNDDFSQDGNSGVSTPTSDISDSWKAVADSSDVNYSNMRVLIENSVFDTSKISPKSVLSLGKLKKLKQDIAEKTELKEYLQEKCSLSSQFCATLLSTPESSSADLDASLLLKILKQISDLQSRLIKVSQELDSLNLSLKNHNLVCLISGYIEDVRISNLSGGAFDVAPSRSRNSDEAQSSRAFEALFSHIASLAAQRNVSLPTYPSDSADSLQEKISWASDCINALTMGSSVPSSASTEETDTTGMEDSLVRDHSFLSNSPFKAYKQAPSSDKTISEYKLALNDLKFSQEYFAKEYEYLKEKSLKTISEYRKKNTYLEKELGRLQSTPATPPSPSRDSLKSKDQEIFRLRRELNSLKIENMGNKSPNTTTAASPSLLSTLDADKLDESTYNPMASPTHSKSMSTAILRKEFRKIVEGIQDQYEIELEEERAKRRELESKVAEHAAAGN